MEKKTKEVISSLVRKYPSYRDDKINGCWRWIEGRRVDDKAEGYWRVHDKLYDLTNFIEKHPGGRNWLELTKVRAGKKLSYFQFIYSLFLRKRM
jgi:Cytochrome b5-like Heme/Steroid binding domain